VLSLLYGSRSGLVFRKRCLAKIRARDMTVIVLAERVAVDAPAVAESVAEFYFGRR